MSTTLTHTFESNESAEAAPDDTVRCPECGLEAVVEWRTVIGSTAGPIEHLKIRCPDRHWFLMPAFLLSGSDVQP